MTMAGTDSLDSGKDPFAILRHARRISWKERHVFITNGPAKCSTRA